MKLSDVIRHLECLASGKCVCPSSHQEAASQAVEILRRMESERRPWQENHGKYQIKTPNFPPVSLEDESA